MSTELFNSMKNINDIWNFPARAKVLEADSMPICVNRTSPCCRELLTRDANKDVNRLGGGGQDRGHADWAGRIQVQDMDKAGYP